MEELSDAGSIPARSTRNNIEIQLGFNVIFTVQEMLEFLYNNKRFFERDFKTRRFTWQGRRGGYGTVERRGIYFWIREGCRDC